MSAAVLDTSALLFWTLAPEKLPSRARIAIVAAQDEQLVVSAISLWEIGLKVQRGTLTLGVSFDEYVSRVQQVDALTIAPVELRTWLRVLSLDWDHRDPADRVIVATADLQQLPLISSDAAMAAFYDRTVWN